MSRQGAVEGRRQVPSIGIDVGATKIHGVLVDGDGKIVVRVRRPTQRNDGPEAVLERIFDVIAELRRDVPDLGGIGIGFAGLVSRELGIVSSSIMLAGWEGFGIVDRVTQVTGSRALVENDATAAGWGEFVALGSPPGLHMVVLTVGTGIGGAIIIDGRLHRGAGGFAGEFGNMSIEMDGALCWCGNRGCLNMLASGSAIAAHALEAGVSTNSQRASAEDVAQAAARGDTAAAAVIEHAARSLGVGIANIVNILNPHRVVLTGGVLALGESFMERVRREAAGRAFRESFDAVRITACTLGDDTGAFGAAMLLRDEVPS